MSERYSWVLRDCFWSYFELTTNEKLFFWSYTSVLIDDTTIFCLQNDGLDMALFIVCNRKSTLPPDRYFPFSVFCCYVDWFFGVIVFSVILLFCCVVFVFYSGRCLLYCVLELNSDVFSHWRWQEVWFKTDMLLMWLQWIHLECQEEFFFPEMLNWFCKIKTLWYTWS